MEPVDSSEVIVQLPSILELHLCIGCTSHTQLGIYFPLHHAFPRLQCLQIVYDNAKCTTCGYVNEDYDTDDEPGALTVPACVQAFVKPVLPYLAHLRMGYVKTMYQTQDGVDRWQLDQLK